MSGRLARRPLPVWAIAFTLPPLIKPNAPEALANTNLTCPPITSVIASPPPRYGTWLIVMPVRSRSSSSNTCCSVPLPDDAISMPPGVALASAITSATVFAGTDGGDDENVRHQRDQKDRIEILAVVEGQDAIKRAVDRKRSGIVQDRVAVGRGFGDHFLADRAAGAAAIFDGELLAETLAEPGIDDARGRVP